MNRASLIALLVAIIAYVHAQGTLSELENMVAGYGYPFERHFVTTADGFILQMFRIPHGRNGTGVNAKVMMLQHGLEDQGGAFLENNPSESLGYIAADAGYDVWIGNSRGCMWSLNHTTLSVSDLAFWNWTWQDMAAYDLPAQFEYALSTNGQAQQGVYVGHSQGTMQAFAAFSAGSTAVNDKIQFAVMMAPVAYMSNTETGLRLLSKVPIGDLERVFGNEGFLMPGDWERFSTYFCLLLPSDCDKALCFFFGCENDSNYNSSRFGLYTEYFPAGTSVKNIDHYMEAIKSGKFGMFNYGSAARNMAAYGQPTPPLFDTTQITVPLITVRGGQDQLADPTDVAKLMAQLPTPALDIYNPEYGHLDPMIGLDAHEKVYAPVLQFLAAHGA